MPPRTKLDSICEECADFSGMETASLQALCGRVQSIGCEVQKVTLSLLPTLNRAVEQFHEKHLKRPVPVASKDTIVNQRDSVGVLLGGIDSLYLQCKQLRAELPPAAVRLHKEKSTTAQTYAVGYSPQYMQSRSLFALSSDDTEASKKLIKDIPAATHVKTAADKSDNVAKQPPLFGAALAKNSAPLPSVGDGFGEAAKKVPDPTDTKAPFGSTFPGKTDNVKPPFGNTFAHKADNKTEDIKKENTAAPSASGFALAPASLGEKKTFDAKSKDNTNETALKDDFGANPFGFSSTKQGAEPLRSGQADAAKKVKATGEGGKAEVGNSEPKPMTGGFAAPAATMSGFSLASKGASPFGSAAPPSKPSTSVDQPKAPPFGSPFNTTGSTFGFGGGDATKPPISGEKDTATINPFAKTPAKQPPPAVTSKSAPGGFPFAAASAVQELGAPSSKSTAASSTEEKDAQKLSSKPSSPSPAPPAFSGAALPAVKPKESSLEVKAEKPQVAPTAPAFGSSAFASPSFAKQLAPVPAASQGAAGPAAATGNEAAQLESAANEAAKVPGAAAVKQDSASEIPAETQLTKPASPPSDFALPAASGTGFLQKPTSASPFGPAPPSTSGFITGVFGKAPAAPPSASGKAIAFGLGAGASSVEPSPFTKMAVGAPSVKPTVSTGQPSDALPQAGPTSTLLPQSSGQSASAAVFPSAPSQPAGVPAASTGAAVSSAASAGGFGQFVLPSNTPAASQTTEQGGAVPQAASPGGTAAAASLAAANSASGFGQPQQLTSQTAAVGAVPSAEGNAFAKVAAQSAPGGQAQNGFGQQQQQQPQQGAFGQPQPQPAQGAFGQPAQQQSGVAAAPQSAFGKAPAQSAFGQPQSQPAQGGFGQPAQQQSGVAAAPQSAFGKAPVQSAFGQPQSQPAQGGFGQPAQQQSGTTFAPQSAFSQPSQQSAFGQPQPAQGAFGQPPQQQSAFATAPQGGFGKGPAVQSAFGATSSGFGQSGAPQQQGFGSVPQNAFSSGSGGSAFQKSSISSLAGNYAQPTQHTGVFGSR